MQTLRRKLSKILRFLLSRKIFFVVYFLLLLTAFYHIYYSHRIIPGVTVGNIRMGGLGYNEAVAKLKQAESNIDKKVILHFEDKSYTIKASDVDLRYDWEGTVMRAFEIGRSGNILKDTKEKIAGVFKNLPVVVSYDYSDEKLVSAISESKVEFNVIAQNAGYKFENGKLIVTPENEGKKVLDEALFSAVVGAFDTLNYGDKTIPGKKVVPKILASDVQVLLPQAQKIVENRITVKSNGRTWILDPEQLLDYLLIQRDKDNNKVELVLDTPRFSAFIEELAQEVNELPRGQVTGVQDKKVTGFKIIQDGRELDKKTFTSMFKEAFFQAKNEVEIPLISVSVPVDKEKFGIVELLGQGSSTYKGSIPGRIKNLTLAAERTNGVLVAPGDTYSMNTAIGDISAKTGYDVAYIIKDGRTVLGSGGGVCQTSTTLFRAVLDSGLPIVMRYPHAYRVSYYEQDRKVGFDAAIFQPSWDFQFKNDTEHYIMVQSEADVPNYSLTFKIYGTSDGREVKITEPEISNQSPPPPALYQDDPTLAKGVVRQVDFPAWGAKVRFSRTVTKNGEQLFTDNFESRYQPWRAVYLVGTKE